MLPGERHIVIWDAGEKRTNLWQILYLKKARILKVPIAEVLQILIV